MKTSNKLDNYIKKDKISQQYSALRGDNWMLLAHRP